MTPDRVLHFARRIARVATSCDSLDHVAPFRQCDFCERQAKAILPILQEAVVEAAEEALVSVLAVGDKVKGAS